ncbi:MAG: hypothetical protein A3G41_03915 [Elusimicrobia bacterium RIFCSPLOWO2_12_FULL_59_9]|nr:MAG: hypothetical protein A3G41_03915 [Elusimicrobia bacterium RIFCSPLOWO2_12_FULL_59_9]
MLTLTENAVKQVKSYFEADSQIRGKALRIALKPSGCAGFEYAFSFDDKKDGDVNAGFDGFEVVVDALSYEKLNGSTLDYEQSETRSGFKISNPQVKGTCGCGKSNQF